MLLKNDMENFLFLFHTYPLSEVIPQAYQELLLSAADAGEIEIRNYPIDTIHETRFRTFKELADKKEEAEMKRQFGDTWWYYAWRTRE